MQFGEGIVHLIKFSFLSKSTSPNPKSQSMSVMVSTSYSSYIIQSVPLSFSITKGMFLAPAYE